MTEQTRRLMRQYDERQIRIQAEHEQLQAQALAMSPQELNDSDLPAWVKGWVSRRLNGLDE